MDYEIKDCIDAGTEYCPCHLAETGDCILCSQLSGKKLCECTNWKGVCIYQEYIWNRKKAKEGRKNYICTILNKEKIGEELLIFTILVPHKLAQDLVYPGSFIFLRNPKTKQFYDTPISVMESDTRENTLKVAIEIKGIKTKSIDSVDVDDKILIRGPFWNGVLGLKNINKSKDGTSVLVCRGIGQAPIVPVMKKLYSNGNKIIAIIDKTNFNNVFIKNYLDMCNATLIECSVFSKGDLTEEFKKSLFNIIKDENVNLIHCAAQDIIIYKALNLIEDSINFSCSNNAKMCCGEGVCGTCTVRYKGQVVKRLCKLQVDPKYIFKDRRLM